MRRGGVAAPSACLGAAPARGRFGAVVQSPAPAARLGSAAAGLQRAFARFGRGLGFEVGGGQQGGSLVAGGLGSGMDG